VAGTVDELSAAGLSPRQIALFLDVDGTLLNLAPRPEAVEVPAGLIDLLAAASRRLDGALALLSGRPIAQLDQLFAPLRLPASGVHGAEIRQSTGVPSRRLTQNLQPPETWGDLLRLLDSFPGTFAENKGVGFTVHHRFSGAAEEALVTALRQFVDQLGDTGLELKKGYRVYEVQPIGVDKGKALELFMAHPPFAGRRPVFIADDPMDRPGFAAALVHGGLAFSVGEPLPGLSGWFARPAAVHEWVGRLAR
jgi:trehalose 6-phosphate phosphatase